jgi:hypothetical protein
MMIRTVAMTLADERAMKHVIAYTKTLAKQAKLIGPSNKFLDIRTVWFSLSQRLRPTTNAFAMKKT